MNSRLAARTYLLGKAPTDAAYFSSIVGLKTTTPCPPFGACFVWGSLQVLDRLTPEYDAATALVARAGFAPSRAGRTKNPAQGWVSLGELYAKNPADRFAR